METFPERWLNFDKEAFFSDIFDAVSLFVCHCLGVCVYSLLFGNFIFRMPVKKV